MMASVYRGLDQVWVTFEKIIKAIPEQKDPLTGIQGDDEICSKKIRKKRLGGGADGQVSTFDLGKLRTPILIRTISFGYHASGWKPFYVPVVYKITFPTCPMIKYTKQGMTTEISADSGYTEILCGALASSLVDRGITPCFPKLFDAQMCDKNVTTISERLDVVLKDVLSTYTFEDILSLVVHIGYASCALSNIGVDHIDAHAENIMLRDRTTSDIWFNGVSLRKANYVLYEYPGLQGMEYALVVLKRTLPYIIDFGRSKADLLPFLGIDCIVTTSNLDYMERAKWQERKFTGVTFLLTLVQLFFTAKKIQEEKPKTGNIDLIVKLFRNILLRLHLQKYVQMIDNIPHPEGPYTHQNNEGLVRVHPSWELSEIVKEYGNDATLYIEGAEAARIPYRLNVKCFGDQGRLDTDMKSILICKWNGNSTATSLSPNLQYLEALKTTSKDCKYGINSACRMAMRQLEKTSPEHLYHTPLLSGYVSTMIDGYKRNKLNISDIPIALQDRTYAIKNVGIDPAYLGMKTIKKKESPVYKESHRMLDFKAPPPHLIGKDLESMMLHVIEVDPMIKPTLHFHKTLHDIAEKLPRGSFAVSGGYFVVNTNVENLLTPNLREYEGRPIGFCWSKTDIKNSGTFVDFPRSYFPYLAVILVEGSKVSMMRYVDFLDMVVTEEVNSLVTLQEDIKGKTIVGIKSERVVLKDGIPQLKSRESFPYDAVLTTGPILVYTDDKGKRRAFSQACFDLGFAAEIKGKTIPYTVAMYKDTNHNPRNTKLFYAEENDDMFPYGQRHSNFLNINHAICWDEYGNVTFVFAEGRGFDAIGIDRPQFAELLVSLGAVNAVSLDGGFTANAVFSYNGIWTSLMKDPQRRVVGTALSFS